MTSNEQSCVKKKVYVKPHLRLYGDVRAPTQTVPSGKGNKDATGKSAHKT